ncbi:hypothetical protein JCM10908_004138 [Rhodotorula pacifica]|uniref:uncharacterized protein n=1 Tax=Rhodotorula pacifica TaxID=1495444 RepID=UPI00316E5059
MNDPMANRFSPPAANQGARPTTFQQLVDSLPIKRPTSPSPDIIERAQFLLSRDNTPAAIPSRTAAAATAPAGPLLPPPARPLLPPARLPAHSAVPHRRPGFAAAQSKTLTPQQQSNPITPRQQPQQQCQPSSESVKKVNVASSSVNPAPSDAIRRGGATGGSRSSSQKPSERDVGLPPRNQQQQHSEQSVSKQQFVEGGAGSFAPSSASTARPTTRTTQYKSRLIVLNGAEPIEAWEEEGGGNAGVEEANQPHGRQVVEIDSRWTRPNPDWGDDPHPYIFRFSASPNIDKLLDYRERLDRRVEEFVEALAAAEDDDSSVWKEARSKPVLATFKKAQGTSDPRTWQHGPMLVPAQFYGREFVRGLSERKARRFFIFGVAGLTCNRANLLPILERADPDSLVVYTFERATKAIEFSVSQLVDLLQTNAARSNEEQLFLDELQGQYDLRHDIQAAYAKNSVAATKTGRAPRKTKEQKKVELQVTNARPIASSSSSSLRQDPPSIAAAHYEGTRTEREDAVAPTTAQLETADDDDDEAGEGSNDDDDEGEEPMASTSTAVTPAAPVSPVKDGRCKDCLTDREKEERAADGKCRRCYRNNSKGGFWYCYGCMDDSEKAEYRQRNPSQFCQRCKLRFAQTGGRCMAHMPADMKAEFVKKPGRVNRKRLRDRYLYSTEQLLDRMVMTLGGRVAEEIFFKRITTGAQDDLQKVTRMATEIVATYGLNSAVGPLSYRQEQESFQKPFSEKTGQLIDDEVRKMVFEAHKRCTDLLTKHRDQVETVAQRLLEREVLTRDDMLEMIGKRPYGDNYDDVMSLGSAAPESAAGEIGKGIEGGLGGGIGNPVPEPKGIEEGARA